MFRRLLALLLALVVLLPTGARAAQHVCGGAVVLTCACEHGGEALHDGDADACCEERQAPSPGPSTLPDLPDAPALVAEVLELALPALPEPPDASTEEERPQAPARGPPHVPIFLEHRALLN